jgi:translocation and assembly module TamB
MTRRKLVALVSAFVLLGLGLVVFAAGLFVTRTAAGRDKLRELIIPFAAKIVHGGATIYIGHLSGNFIGSITIDSVAIHDKRGELFLSTGPVTVSYNWRDIADQRLNFPQARIEHPFVHIVQHESGLWNFKEIFASETRTPEKVTPTQTRSFGGYIVIDSATAHDGTFLLTMPWHPDDSLHGAKRDSSIRAHLTAPSKAYTKTFDGYAKTYAWRNGNGLISHVRLADPDSDRKFGQEFKIGSLSVNEYEPTFTFKNVRGDVRHLGDSVWFDVPHFDMPASTGHGKGKVWWGSDLPVRYDIAIRGDSVSLNDVNWVYPTLPRTGGGTLDVAIKNDAKNLQVVDFRLQNMDVRSTKSHLLGDMWFGTGAPLLLVRNVNLRAEPVDFDLLRTLAGKPFPYDWQGQLTGTVKARGGPLTHFYIDDARGTFDDAHVPGAVSRFSGTGELDILNPALTAFHAFDVNVGSLDLRTPRFLFPGFPPLGGFIAGTATLDSSYLDVRFSHADLTHQDGPGEPSHITGSGRVTDADKFLVYDVNLNAEPLSLSMMARSYPMLPPHLGLWSGPIAASGSSPDLTLKLALQSPNGALSYDGRVDIDSVGGMGGTGHGQFSTLNLAGLFETPRPAGTISGHYDVDVSGETAATLTGTASVSLERTMLDSVRFHPSHAAVHFAGGQMKIDSLRMHTDAATIVATGGLGLPKGTSDSLNFRISIDSLGGLRHFISHPDTALLGAANTLPDSLAGALTVSGYAVGTMDALRVAGNLKANDIYFKTERIASGDATFALTNALSAPAGPITMQLDTVVVAGVVLDRIGGSVTISDASHASFAFDAVSHNGPTAAATGSWSADPATRTQSLTLDSLDFNIIDDRWRLANHPRLLLDSTGLQLDSLLLRNKDSAVVAMSGRVPNDSAAFAHLAASGLPLPDFGALAQLPDTIHGFAGLTLTATGTKANPVIDARAIFSAIRYRDVDFTGATIGLQHRNGRLVANVDAMRNGVTAIAGKADLPISVSLFAAHVHDDSLNISLRADTTDLSVLKLFFPPNALPVVTGRLAADVRAAGTWNHPVFDGNVAMLDGSAAVSGLGITFTGINGRISGGLNAARQDSINIQMTARTSKRDSVALRGFVRNLAQLQRTTTGAASPTGFSFTIDADSLHAFNKRSLADLYVSTTTPLVLSGTVNAPLLTGSVNVDRGSIFLADQDIARKLGVEAFDTIGAPQEKATLFTNLKNNLQAQNAYVTLGQDVRLRSAEANVRLAGRLEVVKSATGRALSSSNALPGALTLAGQLSTIGGTYNLNLGLVQREFEVLPEGTVTFDGGPAETPLVDIRAQYNVKQYRDRDLGVLVTLRGRMPTPGISFSSNQDYAISSSDLLSYLIVGTPGFDFAANGNQQLLGSVFSPTVSALAADRLRQSLPFFDAFEFQLGTSSAADAQAGFLSQRNLGQYLYSSTVSAEKQLTNSLYLSVNTGFCQLQNRLALGAKAEYRFKPQISLQAAYDPPTAARCVEGQQNVVGFVPTPPQWSLSLLHSWRF